MSKQNVTVPVSAQVIIDRYKADKTAKVGVSAYDSLGNLPNNDPTEAQWNQGDKITFPDLDTLKECIIVRPFNGRDLPGIAVDCNGQGKLLYLSTLKKNVLEYEKTPDGFEIVRDAKGAPVTHQSDTQLRKDIMACGHCGKIAELLAGKTIEVKKVEEGLTTARFERQVVDGAPRNVITGLRTTNLPYFDYE